MVVTPEIVFEVQHVPRVTHPDYPGYARLRTVSKDELASLFCETQSSWGDHQNTPCSYSLFVIVPLIGVIVSSPLVRPLLPFHFILSIIDVYRDMATCDKLIFPSAITRILRHFSIPFPVFDHFHVMCAIDAATVKWSEAQLRTRWSRSATPPTPSTPSTSASSSSTGGVTLDAIIAQLQRMDAHLNTLSNELCQVNTRVGHIAK